MNWDQQARKLYDACQSVKPTWDQLGDVTKGVWRQKAKLKAAGVKDHYSIIYSWPHLDLANVDSLADVRMLAAGVQQATRVAGVLRHLQPVRSVFMSKDLNLEKLAEQFDELAAQLTAIGGTFRDAIGGGADKSNERPAAKRASAGKGKAAPVEADPAELTEDDVREALKELVAAKGKEVMVQALESVGASKLAEVDESQYQELMDKVNELKEAEDEPPAKPAAKTAPAKKAAAKKAGPTLDELTEAAKGLIDADKPAYLKIVKKFGKPSEVDEDQYGAMLEAIQAAMPEEGGDDDLL